MPKQYDNHFLWPEKKKKAAIQEATNKHDSELTLVEIALMGNWSDDHNAYFILDGILRSALMHLEDGSTKTVKAILEKLLAWGA